MHPRLLGSLTALVVLAGCPAATDPTAEKSPKSDPVAPATKPKPGPIVDPKTPPMPVVPSLDGARPVPEVKVLSTTTECPALAKLPDDAPASQQQLVPMVELLRTIACKPALFGQSTPAILAELAPPEGLTLTMGRRYASVAVAEPILVTDLLAVAGITGAKLRLEQGWSSSWWVVDASGNTPSPWPPGELRIHIAGSRNDDTPDGTLIDVAADATVTGNVTIVMPETALEFEPDPHAAAVLLDALVTLATDPATLDSGALPTLGERYTSSPYSEGMGAEQRKGVAIRPLRTEVVASELAELMGIPSPAHESIHITDTNPNRLRSADATPFEWRGLNLEIELSERPGNHLGLAGWLVTDVQVLPLAPTGE